MSANAEDVRAALTPGFPAARICAESRRLAESHPNEVRIAFGGDAVRFSDEAERVFEALHKLREDSSEVMKVRTALVTARNAPAHERAIRTLLAWNVEIDEALFLGGLARGQFPKEFEPDFNFDDQTGHCESTALAGPTRPCSAGYATRCSTATAATLTAHTLCNFVTDARRAPENRSTRIRRRLVGDGCLRQHQRGMRTRVPHSRRSHAIGGRSHGE